MTAVLQPARSAAKTPAGSRKRPNGGGVQYHVATANNSPPDSSEGMFDGMTALGPTSPHDDECTADVAGRLIAGTPEQRHASGYSRSDGRRSRPSRRGELEARAAPVTTSSRHHAHGRHSFSDGRDGDNKDGQPEAAIKARRRSSGVGSGRIHRDHGLEADETGSVTQRRLAGGEDDGSMDTDVTAAPRKMTHPIHTAVASPGQRRRAQSAESTSGNATSTGNEDDASRRSSADEGFGASSSSPFERDRYRAYFDHDPHRRLDDTSSPASGHHRRSQESEMDVDSIDGISFLVENPASNPAIFTDDDGKTRILQRRSRKERPPAPVREVEVMASESPSPSPPPPQPESNSSSAGFESSAMDDPNLWSMESPPPPEESDSTQAVDNSNSTNNSSVHASPISRIISSSARGATHSTPQGSHAGGGESAQGSVSGGAHMVTAPPESGSRRPRHSGGGEVRIDQSQQHARVSGVRVRGVSSGSRRAHGEDGGGSGRRAGGSGAYGRPRRERGVRGPGGHSRRKGGPRGPGMPRGRSMGRSSRGGRRSASMPGTYRGPGAWGLAPVVEEDEVEEPDPVQDDDGEDDADEEELMKSRFRVTNRDTGEILGDLRHLDQHTEPMPYDVLPQFRPSEAWQPEHEALEQAQEQAAEAAASPLDLATTEQTRGVSGLAKTSKSIAARRGPSIRAMMRIRRGKMPKEGEEDADIGAVSGVGGGRAPTAANADRGSGGIRAERVKPIDAHSAESAIAAAAAITWPKGQRGAEAATVAAEQHAVVSSKASTLLGIQPKPAPAANKAKTSTSVASSVVTKSVTVGSGGEHAGTSTIERGASPSPSSPIVRTSPGSGERGPTRQEMAAAQVAKRRAAFTGGLGLMENAFLAATVGGAKLPSAVPGGALPSSSSPSASAAPLPGTQKNTALTITASDSAGPSDRSATGVSGDLHSSPPPYPHHHHHADHGEGNMDGASHVSGGDRATRAKDASRLAHGHHGHRPRKSPTVRSRHHSTEGTEDSGSGGGNNSRKLPSSRPTSLPSSVEIDMLPPEVSRKRRQRRMSAGNSGESDSPSGADLAMRGTKDLSLSAELPSSKSGVGMLSMSLSPRSLMAALSPKGGERGRATAAAAARAARLAAVGQMQLLQHFRAHAGAVWCAEFSRKGQYLATGGADGLVKIWHVGPPEEESAAQSLRERGRGGNAALGGALPKNRLERCDSDVSVTSVASIVSIATSAGGSSLDSQNRPSALPTGELVIGGRAWRVLRGHKGDVVDLSWSPNAFLLSAGRDGSLRLWHPGRLGCVHLFAQTGSAAPTSCAFHPRLENSFATAGEDGKIRVWKITSGRVESEAQMPAKTTHVRFSPDGKGLAAGMMGGQVRFLTPESLLPIAHLELRNRKGGGGVSSIAFKSASRCRGEVLISGATGRLRMFRIEPLAGGSQAIAAAVSSAKRHGGTSSGVGVTRLPKLKGHLNPALPIRASVSEDGSLAVSGSEDGHVHVWDTGPEPDIPWGWTGQVSFKATGPPPKEANDSSSQTSNTGGSRTPSLSPPTSLSPRALTEEDIHGKNASDETPRDRSQSPPNAISATSGSTLSSGSRGREQRRRRSPFRRSPTSRNQDQAAPGNASGSRFTVETENCNGSGAAVTLALFVPKAAMTRFEEANRLSAKATPQGQQQAVKHTRKASRLSESRRRAGIPSISEVLNNNERVGEASHQGRDPSFEVGETTGASLTVNSLGSMDADLSTGRWSRQKMPAEIPGTTRVVERRVSDPAGSRARPGVAEVAARGSSTSPPYLSTYEEAKIPSTATAKRVNAPRLPVSPSPPPPPPPGDKLRSPPPPYQEINVAEAAALVSGPRRSASPPALDQLLPLFHPPAAGHQVPERGHESGHHASGSRQISKPRQEDHLPRIGDDKTIGAMMNLASNSTQSELTKPSENRMDWPASPAAQPPSPSGSGSERSPDKHSRSDRITRRNEVEPSSAPAEIGARRQSSGHDVPTTWSWPASDDTSNAKNVDGTNTASKVAGEGVVPGEKDEEGAPPAYARGPVEANSLMVATDSLGNVRIFAKESLMEALAVAYSWST